MIGLCHEFVLKSLWATCQYLCAYTIDVCVDILKVMSGYDISQSI